MEASNYNVNRFSIVKNFVSYCSYKFSRGEEGSLGYGQFNVYNVIIKAGKRSDDFELLSKKTIKMTNNIVGSHQPHSLSRILAAS